MRLPGFFDAGDLIPGYPFVSGGTTSEEEEEEKEEEEDDEGEEFDGGAPFVVRPRSHMMSRGGRRSSPLPAMPSPLFASLARSQFELLSSSLLVRGSGSGPATKKVRSAVLYLPKENDVTGRLEFVPAATYDADRASERRGVFIAPPSSYTTSTSTTTSAVRGSRRGVP